MMGVVGYRSGESLCVVHYGFLERMLESRSDAIVRSSHVLEAGFPLLSNHLLGQGGLENVFQKIEWFVQA